MPRRAEVKGRQKRLAVQRSRATKQRLFAAALLTPPQVQLSVSCISSCSELLGLRVVKLVSD